MPQHIRGKSEEGMELLQWPQGMHRASGAGRDLEIWSRDM
jgi:hypothetical protein